MHIWLPLKSNQKFHTQCNSCYSSPLQANNPKFSRELVGTPSLERWLPFFLRRWIWGSFQVDQLLSSFLADPIEFTKGLSKGRRRVIKTHLPLSFLPHHLLKTCKVVVPCWDHLNHPPLWWYFPSRLSWWRGTWGTAPSPTSTTMSTSPLTTSSETSPPLPKCSGLASSTMARTGDTREALKRPREF